MNNITSLHKSNCTGCGMCANICPRKAIQMKDDRDGFRIPIVDSGSCNSCGLCASACPQLNDNNVFSTVKKANAVICDDKIREKASSGGIFGAIGTWAIEQGGCVFGAAFDDDFRGISHKRADTIDELETLYKSKYFQSDMNDVYRQIKSALKETSKPVVFCGCPCQVNALKRFLGKEYENLVLIDILCHGVVSPKAYRKFLDEILDGVDSPIKSIDFRPKKLGWACNNVDIITQDGTERISPNMGSYFNAFLWGYSQRKACFECRYARAERVGDITIGDFWGIDGVLPEMNDKRGTSLVLCNTPKAEKILSLVGKNIKRIKECAYSDVLRASTDVNWALIKPGVIPPNRHVFFYRLSRGDAFSQAFRYASTSKFDVGIFGWWFEDDWTNYGSTLTYYALMEYVSSLGLSVCMLTSPFHNAKNASDFVLKHGYRISPTYKFEEFAKHNANIDTFLIGSDQLWFYDCYKKWGHSLFLDFAADDKKKIAYATSFGHADPHIPDSELPELKRLLKRFDGISTRETVGVDVLRNKFGVSSTQNLDPVFLCDVKYWDSIAKDARRKASGDYVFTYMLDPTPEKITALKHISRALKLPIVSVTDKQYGKGEKEAMLENLGLLRGASISELIYHLKNAKYVITDSFHGTCFCLIFKKNFTSITNPKRGTSRFETLAALLGIQDRLVDNPKNIVNNQALLKRPDYSVISPLIDKESARSKAWLNNQLLSPKSAAKVQLQPSVSSAPRKKVIHELTLLGDLGYSVGQLLCDMGITHISVYCDEKYLDVFEVLLMSLQFSDSVIVDEYYSNRAFEYRYAQSRSFGMVNFRQGLPTNGTLVYVSDEILPFKAPGCNVMSMLALEWKALAYATSYRPLVQFKKKHPRVSLLTVNYPLFPPADKLDEREKRLHSNARAYDYDSMMKQLPDTFAALGKSYSHKDWCELFSIAASEIDVNGKRIYEDCVGKLMNIRDNRRVTTNQPDEYTNTIYILGDCKVFGYACEDADTLQSCLQRRLNEHGIRLRVENCGGFLEYRREDLFRTLFDLPVRDGDIVISESWSAPPDFIKEYTDYTDMHELFFRPHSYGNVFIDSSRYSHIGQSAIAEKLFEYLESKSFYGKEAQKDTNSISIEPMKLYGIPNDAIDNSDSPHIHPELRKFVTTLKQFRMRVGAIVMNCNPFTLGHRYLIETAAKHCQVLYVFVVEEDKSAFGFDDRIELARMGTEDLTNVVVLSGGKFILSELTFKDYFDKGELQNADIDPTTDIKLFGEHIAPALGINVRFAGEEPLDTVTRQYNDTMKRILPHYNVNFVELPRMEKDGHVISASRVRELFDDGDFTSIAELVPSATLEYLKRKFDN